MNPNWETLGETFDQAADLYQRARPDYPADLYDDVVRVAGLSHGDRLLEVGCATGKATLPLARRGFSIACIERGPALAAVARRNLAGFDVDVRVGRFEDAELEPASFALVYAATAWGWIDLDVRYTKSWHALRPGGHLAIWGAGHVCPRDGDPFFEEIQEVYDEIGEGLPPDAVRPRPGELADDVAEIEGSGLFDVVHVRQFDWERVYDTEGYIELLKTFSGHIAMEPSKRDYLFAAVREKIGRRPEGTVRRHWGGVLHIARRRDVEDNG